MPVPAVLPSNFGFTSGIQVYFWTQRLGKRCFTTYDTPRTHWRGWCVACARREFNSDFRHEVHVWMLPPFRVNPEIEPLRRRVGRNHAVQTSARHLPVAFAVAFPNIGHTPFHRRTIFGGKRAHVKTLYGNDEHPVFSNPTTSQRKSFRSGATVMRCSSTNECSSVRPVAVIRMLPHIPVCSNFTDFTQSPAQSERRRVRRNGSQE